MEMTIGYTKSILLGAFGIGGQELILIIAVCLLLFGGKKIPELMRGLGRGVQEFKRGQAEAPKPEHESGKENI